MSSGQEEGLVHSGGRDAQVCRRTGGVSEGAGCWWLCRRGQDGEGLGCQGRVGVGLPLGCVCGGGA